MAPSPRIRIIAKSERARAADWALGLAGFDPAAARYLKQDSSTSVWMAELLGRPIVVKRWSLRQPGLGFRSVLRASPAWRHWRGAAWLRNHGLRTAEPILIARQDGAEWLIMEAIEGKTLLQHLADRDLSLRDERQIARAVAAMLMALSRAGRYNRDGKPSNLIPIRTDAGWQIAILDCVAIRRRARSNAREPVGSLARLMIESMGTGALPRRALRMRVVRAMVDAGGAGPGSGPTAARDLWWRAAERIRSHGDPTPRINPLAHPVAPR